MTATMKKLLRKADSMNGAAVLDTESQLWAAAEALLADGLAEELARFPRQAHIPAQLTIKAKRAQG